MELSRRKLLVGLIAAPAIVKVATLMPIKPERYRLISCHDIHLAITDDLDMFAAEYGIIRKECELIATVDNKDWGLFSWSESDHDLRNRILKEIQRA